uniref:Signal peptide protein n=1 Tax=Macrostomum lignano TaxID=282301 RepID=A0A1I8J3C9_9PLAT
MDRIRNLVIAFGLGLLTLLSQDATAATRYVSSDRYSSSFSYRSDQSNRLSSFQSNTRSYYTPYKSGGFRKSDYIMPVGILQRMGGVSTLKKERLLLAGSVYVGSRMRHKFSSTGDGNGYSYLNTYDDIAVCESPSFKAPVNKDLSTRPSNQRNRNVPQPNAVAHPPMQMAGPPVPYAPVPGSAVATNLPTAAYPRQPMGHDPAVPASAPPADAGFSGYPALQAPPPAYSPPEDKSYQ